MLSVTECEAIASSMQNRLCDPLITRPNVWISEALARDQSFEYPHRMVSSIPKGLGSAL